MECYNNEKNSFVCSHRCISDRVTFFVFQSNDLAYIRRFERRTYLYGPDQQSNPSNMPEYGGVEGAYI